MDSTSNTFLAIKKHLVEKENLGCDYVRIVSLDLFKAFALLRHLNVIDALRRMKSNAIHCFINVIIQFLEGRTQTVLFHCDIFGSLAKNRGALQGEVNLPTYCSLYVAALDSFCITESAFSPFADDINVLCADFTCPISGQPAVNAQIDIQ